MTTPDDGARAASDGASPATPDAAMLPSGDAVAALGRILLGEGSLDRVLDEVVGLARRGIPGVEEASVTMMPGEDPVSVAYTGPLALEVDERQYDTDSGPCLDAIRFGEVVVVEDMDRETRWPSYVPRARAAGVVSSLSVPLRVPDRQVGGLNLYARRPGAFDGESVRTAQVFAGVAATALANAHLYHVTASLAEQLRTAMQSRAVIEQAKGVLMAERRCDDEEAFTILVQLSQRSNRKLRDVARALVRSVYEQQ